MLLESLSLSVALSLSCSHFLYFHSFSIFSPLATEARGAVPRESGLCLCVVVHARKTERVQEIVNMQKSLKEKDSKPLRVCEKEIVCVCTCVLLFLRLSNWDMGSVCAVH